MVEIQGSQPIPKGELLLASTSLLFVPPIFSISKNILSTLYCGIIFPLVGMKKKLHNGSMILLYKGLQKKKKNKTQFCYVFVNEIMFLLSSMGVKKIYTTKTWFVFLLYIFCTMESCFCCIYCFHPCLIQWKYNSVWPNIHAKMLFCYGRGVHNNTIMVERSCTQEALKVEVIHM